MHHRCAIWTICCMCACLSLSMNVPVAISRRSPTQQTLPSWFCVVLHRGGHHQSNTYHHAQLACFVRVVRVIACQSCFLSVWCCHGKCRKPYLRTIEQNAIFGRTQDHLSINNIATKQGKRGNDDDDDDDDDDDGVYALHAAVNEERVKVCGLV